MLSLVASWAVISICKIINFSMCLVLSHGYVFFVRLARKT